jgi:polyisoprenoid-binding protein YceI
MNTATPTLEQGTWVLDKTHSTVEFSVRHMGISKVRGSFKRLDASLTVGAAPTDSTLTASVDMSSVDTNNATRDGHLHSTDFFNVEGNHTMDFVSSSINETSDGRYLMTGALTINGITNEQSFDVEFHGQAVFPMDNSTHAGFTATGSLSRKSFGIDFNVPLAAGGFVIGDKIDIELEIQLLPAAQADAFHNAFLPSA